MSTHMKVTLLYFAGIREAVGRKSEQIELDCGDTVQTVLDWLKANRPAAYRLTPHARIAVNQEFVDTNFELTEASEIALLPPVSGGSGTKARLSHDVISPHAAEELLDTTGAGAVIHFTGVVRPTSKKGRRVDTLDYEAYEPMAIKKLEQCLHEACAAHKILDAVVVHRLGHLTLGEIAVSIAVAAKHRQEGFLATQHIIDRLKEIVPIWKKETGPDGTEWVSEGA